MTAKRKATFETESELCSVFTACIGDEWIAYAETAGWDILLVRKADGCQIGVEAKLKLNAWVLAQALEGLASTWVNQGPDYRAVLVPEGTAVDGVGQLAGQIGVSVVRLRDQARNGPRSYGYNEAFYPDLPKPDGRFNDSAWHEWLPAQRHSLPDFVPDVIAGTSAPVQLTTWKVKALKLAVLLEVRGAVNRADFFALHLDARRWTDKWTGWLEPTPQGYVARSGMPDFKGQHPKVYADLLASIADWAPPATLAFQPSLPELSAKSEKT